VRVRVRVHVYRFVCAVHAVCDIVWCEWYGFLKAPAWGAHVCLIYVDMCVHIDIYQYMFISILIHVCIHTYQYTHTHTLACVCESEWVCVCGCVGNLPKQAVEHLHVWLKQHWSHPYPTDQDKQVLSALVCNTWEVCLCGWVGGWVGGCVNAHQL